MLRTPIELEDCKPTHPRLGYQYAVKDVVHTMLNYCFPGEWKDFVNYSSVEQMDCIPKWLPWTGDEEKDCLQFEDFASLR
jgi:hypothetical protein